MNRTRYSPIDARFDHPSPLLRAVAAGIAEPMPVVGGAGWPQPLLDLVALLRGPDALALPPPPVVVVGCRPTMTERAAALPRAGALSAEAEAGSARGCAAGRSPRAVPSGWSAAPAAGRTCGWSSDASARRP